MSEEIQLLRERKTYTANFLLLELYASNPDTFGDEAIDLVCSEPWRLECGYSNSNYWVAGKFVAAVMRAASKDRRVQLESVVLQFRPNWERSRDGVKYRGRACFDLLSSVPTEDLSPVARRRFQELCRRFRRPTGPPAAPRACWVRPPIDQLDARKMNDQQWLRAMAKYAAKDRAHHWKDPGKGGASELAGLLSSIVGQEPGRFTELLLTFPDGTNPAYVRAVLNGLKVSTIDVCLKLKACRFAFNRYVEHCGESLADLIASVETKLPTDITEMISWLATKHPDPPTGSWKQKADSDVKYADAEPHMHGLNTTRGRAAEAIRDLIVRDCSYVACFESSLEELVRDEDLGVRACAASALIALAITDKPRAIQLFVKLVNADDRLLLTHYVDRFLYRALPNNFSEVRPVIDRLLRSDEPKGREAGARLVCLALLHGHHCQDLVEAAIKGDDSSRLGATQVAAKNVGVGDCREWCEDRLRAFFDDPADAVRSEAASCFHEIPSIQIPDYHDLIEAFCASKAYKDDAFSILNALVNSTLVPAEITHHVCEKFLDRFGSEASDISTHKAADAGYVSELVFRNYHQHQSDDWASRCLDLVDRMCLEGFHGIYEAFEKYER